MLDPLPPLLPSAFACSLSFGLSPSSLLALLVLLGFSEQPKLILICLPAEDFFHLLSACLKTLNRLQHSAKPEEKHSGGLL